MAFVIPAAWSATTNYSRTNRVSLGGVIYEAINDITGNANNQNPSQDGTNWKVAAVTRVSDYNSLVEAVRLQLNDTDPNIYDSIPLFISLTEESIKTRVRLPQQIKTVTLQTTTGPDGESRVRVPAGMLEIDHVRRLDMNFGDGFATTPYENDSIEILSANKEEYLRVLRANRAYGIDFFSFDTAVYWWDNAFLNFAPGYDDGVNIEVTYRQIIPQLGTIAGVTNLDGDPINAAGQTLQEWVAAGNTASTFMQEMRTVTTNEFLSIAPQMLLYGACLRAKPFLREDDSRIQQWTSFYVEAEKELTYMVDTFEESQAHTLYIQNTYAQNI